MTIDELRACRMLLGKFIVHLRNTLSPEDLQSELVDSTELTYAFLNSVIKNGIAEASAGPDPAR